MAGKRVVRLAEKQAIHVGFVPLIDAAPIIAAYELGFFADEGLTVRLERQIGWGNVRDKLSYGKLHASHALVGMPPASVAGLDWFHEPLVAVMSLGAGGNAITVSTYVAERCVGNSGSPSGWRRVLDRTPVVAHVFSCSTHHFFLRDFLSSAGVNPDSDVQLCVLPPPQLVAHLGSDSLDAFCSGEPWNTLAVMQGRGVIVMTTAELMPDHPEKVLAVTRRWYQQNQPATTALIRATLRGCDFCEEEKNHGRLAEILAEPAYLGLDESVVARSLSFDTWYKPPSGPSNRGARRPRFRSFSRETTVPRVEHAQWMVRQMARWGRVPADADAGRIANTCVSDEAYFDAVATLGNTSLNSPMNIADDLTAANGSIRT